MRLKNDENNSIEKIKMLKIAQKKNHGFVTRTGMLDRDSKQPPHSRHYHVHYQLQYQLIEREIGQILDSGTVIVAVSLQRRRIQTKSKLTNIINNNNNN